MPLAPVPISATTLSLEIGQRLVDAAPRVLVVPSGRVEGAPLEVLHTGDGRQLHQVEDPHRQDVPATADRVAAVGVEEPTTLVLLPLGPRHAGVEQRIILEAVAIGDPLEVAPDFVTRT